MKTDNQASNIHQTTLSNTIEKTPTDNEDLTIQANNTDVVATVD